MPAAATMQAMIMGTNSRGASSAGIRSRSLSIPMHLFAAIGFEWVNRRQVPGAAPDLLRRLVQHFGEAFSAYRPALSGAEIAGRASDSRFRGFARRCTENRRAHAPRSRPRYAPRLRRMCI
jgi:hypothetical protein